jgi:ribosomal protein S27AE
MPNSDFSNTYPQGGTKAGYWNTENTVDLSTHQSSDQALGSTMHRSQNYNIGDIKMTGTFVESKCAWCGATALLSSCADTGKETVSCLWCGFVSHRTPVNARNKTGDRSGGKAEVGKDGNPIYQTTAEGGLGVYFVANSWYPSFPVALTHYVGDEDLDRWNTEMAIPGADRDRSYLTSRDSETGRLSVLAGTPLGVSTVRTMILQGVVRLREDGLRPRAGIMNPERCPQCGGWMHGEHESRNDTGRFDCDRCGFQWKGDFIWKRPSRSKTKMLGPAAITMGEEGYPLVKSHPQLGYGVTRIAFKDGSCEFHHWHERAWENGVAEWQHIMFDPNVDVARSYQTEWDPELKQLTIIHGLEAFINSCRAPMPPIPEDRAEIMNALVGSSEPQGSSAHTSPEVNAMMNDEGGPRPR